MVKAYTLSVIYIIISYKLNVRFNPNNRTKRVWTSIQIVKDFHLLGLVFAVVAVDVFILVVWEIVDPLRIVTVNLETVVG